MAHDRQMHIPTTLVEALPYIKRFQGRTLVIKYGGSLLADEAAKRSFAEDLVLLKCVGMRPVVVHGGGEEITAWTKRLGKPTQFIDGQRVTDEETETIAEMVLTGKVNGEFTTLINVAGGRAVGLSGKDGPLFTARRNPARNLGLVGEIEAVDTSLLEVLTAQGYIPVISSLALSRQRESLTVSSDEAATALAAHAGAAKLIHLTNVSGIMSGGKLLEVLDLSEAQKLAEGSEVSGGMLSKLRQSIAALKAGVPSVHIVDGTLKHAVLLEVLTDRGVGTMITNEWMRI